MAVQVVNFAFISGTVQYYPITADTLFVRLEAKSASGGRGDVTPHWDYYYGGRATRCWAHFRPANFAPEVTQLAVVVGGKGGDAVVDYYGGGNPTPPGGWPDGGPGVPARTIFSGNLAGWYPGSSAGGASTSIWTANADGDLLDLLLIAGGGGGVSGPRNGRIVGGGGGGGYQPGGGGGARWTNPNNFTFRSPGQTGGATTVPVKNKNFPRGGAGGVIENADGAIHDNWYVGPATPGRGGRPDVAGIGPSATHGEGDGGGRHGTWAAGGVGNRVVGGDWATGTGDLSGGGGGGASYVNTTHPAFAPEADWAYGFTTENYTNGSARVEAELQVPPNAPTLSPVPTFPQTSPVTFSWAFSDPNEPFDGQTAYQLQVRRSVDQGIVLDTGKVLSTNEFRTQAAGTFVDNTQYQWRVKNWDQTNKEGPYSGWATFRVSARPTALVTNPASDGAVLQFPTHTVTWSYEHSGGEEQAHFQVRLRDLDTDTILSDSGKRAGSATSWGISNLQNEALYRVEVMVWSASNLPSQEWATRDFTVDFIGPESPTVSVTSRPEFGALEVRVSNPPPSDGTIPQVASNIIERRARVRAVGVDVVNGDFGTGSFAPWTGHATTGGSFGVVQDGDNYVGQLVISSSSHPPVTQIRQEGIVLPPRPDARAEVTFRVRHTAGATRAGFRSGTTNRGNRVAFGWLRADNSLIYPLSSQQAAVYLPETTPAWTYRAAVREAPADAVALSVYFIFEGDLSGTVQIDDVELAILFDDGSDRFNWQQVATGVAPDGFYLDPNVQARETYQYRAIALAVNGTETIGGPSSDDNSVDLQGAWLHFLNDPESVTKFLYGRGRKKFFDPKVAFSGFAGRKAPVSEVSDAFEEGIIAEIQVPHEETDSLLKFIEAQEPVVYRDGRGHIVFGAIDGSSWSDTPWGAEVTITVRATEEATVRGGGR